mmetsp:Transcript_6663/g.24903  ORF Transcript_6663/g.24903 Transcript_6663/m.24903 type:complete len:701 (+) Transcript_6663:954-3056(+)
MRDPVLVAGLVQVGERDVAVAIHVQALEHVRGLEFAAVGALHRGDVVAEQLHYVPCLPVVLVARDLAVSRPLAGRAVASQVAVQPIVDAVDGLALVLWLVEVVEELLDRDLVVLVRPLCGQVGVDIGLTDVDAAARWGAATAAARGLPLRGTGLRAGGGGVLVKRHDIGRGPSRHLLRHRILRHRLLHLLQEQVRQLVLVDHLPVLQQLPQPLPRDPGRQRPLDPHGLVLNVFHILRCQHRSLPGLVEQGRRTWYKLVGDDDHGVGGILVWPAQIRLPRVALRQREGPLQQVVLTLASLQADWRRRPVVVAEVGELAHEISPIHFPVVDVALLVGKHGRPQKLDSLLRHVVASRPECVVELGLADLVPPVRVQLTEGVPQLRAIGEQAIHQGSGDMRHVAILSLVIATAHLEVRAQDQVRELLEVDGTLAVLVASSDEQTALALIDLDPHLVKHHLNVLREGEAGLLEAAVFEDAHEPGPAGVALLQHLPQAPHAVDAVGPGRRRVRKVRQVDGPDLEVVARLLRDGIQQAAAWVVLLLVEVHRVLGLGVPAVGAWRADVLGTPDRSHEPVLALDVALDLCGLVVVPRLPILPLQRALFPSRRLVPPRRIPTGRRPVALLPCPAVHLNLLADALLRFDRGGRLLRRRAQGGLLFRLGLFGQPLGLRHVAVRLPVVVAREFGCEVLVTLAAGDGDLLVELV